MRGVSYKGSPKAAVEFILVHVLELHDGPSQPHIRHHRDRAGPNADQRHHTVIGWIQPTAINRVLRKDNNCTPPRDQTIQNADLAICSFMKNFVSE
jgi:hypothetical protein